ncbi:MAG: capsular biosynthesis protein CpsI, partial [Desulfamplus sp.]|nr:capsular biosynthesis protein CpsI [Desulfamplus sp.]
FQTASNSHSPYELYNIGNNTPVELNLFIETLEYLLGRKAVKNFLPMQPGDVPVTYADIAALTRKTGLIPDTSIQDGLGAFVSWYLKYYEQ